MGQGGRGGGNQGLDSSFIFQVGPTGLTDGSDVRYERKGASKRPQDHWL